MPRFFLEVQYQGTRYSGFQIQQNANTIQAEVQRSFQVLQKQAIEMTGSSRTDAGVHALQNYFHFDFDGELNPHFVYKINAILPYDIVVKDLIKVSPQAHCRFDAVSREYKYYCYRTKSPFLKQTAYFFPYKLNIERMNEAADEVMKHNNFTSFSKKNTQVKNFECTIIKSEWIVDNECLIYNVVGNRFLRGMVRGLTSTMLKIGRGTLSIEEFRDIIASKDCTKASFAVPSHGLILTGVKYPRGYFK